MLGGCMVHVKIWVCRSKIHACPSNITIYVHACWSEEARWGIFTHHNCPGHIISLVTLFQWRRILFPNCIHCNVICTYNIMYPFLCRHYLHLCRGWLNPEIIAKNYPKMYISFNTLFLQIYIWLCLYGHSHAHYGYIVLMNHI